MRKIVFTPCFAKASLVDDLIRHLKETQEPNYEHVLIDNHYPVNKNNNRFRIAQSAINSGAIYVDSRKDLGLHVGINNALRELSVGPDDLVIGCDPDDRPAPHAFTALFEVMETRPPYFALGLNFTVPQMRKAEGVPFVEKKIGQHMAWEHPSIEMWNICAYNMRFIHEIGGFHEPFEFYGGIEMYLYQMASKKNLKLAYLADYRSDQPQTDRNDERLFDPQYQEWKNAHISGYKYSFEQYLKDRNLGYLID